MPDRVCPYRTNPGQEDAGGLGAGSAPDGTGDVCQCGNVSGDGRVAPEDVTAYRQALASPTGAALSSAAQTRCVVYRTGTACNLLPVTVIRRALHVPALGPITSSALAQNCAASKP